MLRDRIFDAHVEHLAERVTRRVLCRHLNLADAGRLGLTGNPERCLVEGKSGRKSLHRHRRERKRIKTDGKVKRVRQGQHRTVEVVRSLSRLCERLCEVKGKRVFGRSHKPGVQRDVIVAGLEVRRRAPPVCALVKYGFARKLGSACIV